MYNWRGMSGPLDNDVALDHPTMSTAYVMYLSGRHEGWWVSGRTQPVRTFGPYATAVEGKKAAIVLQASGFLDDVSFEEQ